MPIPQPGNPSTFKLCRWAERYLYLTNSYMCNVCSFRHLCSSFGFQKVHIAGLSCFRLTEINRVEVCHARMSYNNNIITDWKKFLFLKRDYQDYSVVVIPKTGTVFCGWAFRLLDLDKLELFRCICSYCAVSYVVSRWLWRHSLTA